MLNYLFTLYREKHCSVAQQKANQGCLLSGNGGHTDTSLGAGVLVLSNKLDGASASLGDRGVVLQCERPQTSLLLQV